MKYYLISVEELNGNDKNIDKLVINEYQYEKLKSEAKENNDIKKEKFFN